MSIVLDVAAGELETIPEEVEVDIITEGGGRREGALPDLLARLAVREGKLDDEVEAPGKSLIDVLLQLSILSSGCDSTARRRPY